MQRIRNRGIDYLRGVLILLIFVSHSSDFEVVGGQSIWGAAGVTGFFVISGFLSYINWKQLMKEIKCYRECVDSIISFLKKFYPIYFASLCIYIFVRPGSYKDFIKCAFLLQSYCGSTNTAMAFNGNAWFLSSLMLCYVVSPILNRGVRKVNRTNAFIIMAGMFCIQLFLPLLVGNVDFSVGYYWVYICPVVRLIDFFEGMLLAKMIENNTETEQTFLRGGGAGLLLYLIELLIVNYFPIVLYQYNVVWVPVTLVLVACFYLFPEKEISNLPGNKIIVECGKRSFELFVCHRLILLEVARIDTGLCAWILALSISIVTAFLLHTIIKNYEKVF